jgi:hypothetical protein
MIVLKIIALIVFCPLLLVHSIVVGAIKDFPALVKVLVYSSLLG